MVFSPALFPSIGRGPLRPVLAGYLVLRPDGWLEPTTERAEATHAHAVDPASGDLIVVTIAEAQAMERPREVVVGGTLLIYGV
jgi:hypothetical protein